MRKVLLLLSAIALLASAACTDSPDNSPVDNPTETPGEGGGETPTPPEEEKPAEPEGDYPKGITVEEFKDNLGDGDFCSGYIATIDFTQNEKIGFGVVHNVPTKKPSEIYSGYKKKGKQNVKAEIVINGGYFAGTTSVSLAISGGYAWANNATSMNWPNDEKYEKTVYPVRSALGMMEDGSFDAQWVYCVDPSSKTQYSFPSPLDNDEQNKVFMSEPPTKDTPGGQPWKPREAIGGGPRLVKDGKNVAMENYWKEVLHSGGTSGAYRVPRTAIGYTADNKLILIVCDGRGMNGSAGFKLSELAEKFISLGATDAINLDGGGSSCMVGKDGAVLNRPSDSGTGDVIKERKVPTAVVIYQTVD